MIGGKDGDSCGKSGRSSGRDEEAHRPPAESEVLHGNQQRRNNLFMIAHLPHLFILD
ncbi:hypothetical protein [Priestia megaterium]|uniref:hypothetical protein n=1 Tax=Priestia megaterium TaxID=1404 RepID=UPI00366C4E88